MTYQAQSNIQVAFKVQSGLGSAASGSGATVFRPSGGNGLGLSKQLIQSNEIRGDGQETRGRHGSRQVAGSYEGELSLGTFDKIIEAVQRGTIGSALVLTQSDVTSITTTASTIVAASGDWIALGLRVGDIIRLTGHATTANNSKNLRITALSATTITVAETLVLDATPDTSITITRPKKLINPGSGSLVERYFTVMEREIDIDAEEAFADCKFGSFKIGMTPNGMVTFATSLVGRDVSVASGASSPSFTSPTSTTSLPMAVTDATIRLASGDLVDITALDLTFDLTPTAPPVLGNGGVAPDVFSGLMQASGSLTLLRSDLSRVSSFLAETQMSLWLMCVENESEPKDFCSFFLPNITFAGDNKSAINKAGGPRSMTIPLLIGANDAAASGEEPGTFKFQTTSS